MTHFKGKYRLKAPYDLKTHQFPREINGQLADNDIYIDCYNKIQISSYGQGILEVYIPSIGRGHNIVNAIKSELGEDVIFNIMESDFEVIFRFKAKDMDKLEKYLKPKTSGAKISPFSSKNLPKTKYNIPDEDLVTYKNIIEKLGKNRIIELTHITNDYLKSLTNKRHNWEDIKADMALKGLKGKDYIHSIGKWNDYIKYIEKRINI